MLTWDLLLIKRVLVLLVFHRLLFGQFEIIESFDPEKSLPESDLIILNTASTIYQGLTEESAALLSQLSFLTDNEAVALGEFVKGDINDFDQFQRIQMVVTELWEEKKESNINGVFYHRINFVDDVQYKWIGELNFEKFTFGFLGERDGEEINILDNYSTFIETRYGENQFIIGNFQMLSGYGLISWRTFPVKSDFGTINSALRRGRGIQPFRSGHESWAYRGFGWTRNFDMGQISGSISSRDIDGSIQEESVKLSSLGLHISDSQVENHNNITEIIGLVNWQTAFKSGEIGITTGSGLWIDNERIKFLNIASSLYGNYQILNLKIFSEIAFTSQLKSAIITGGRLKHDSFYYGIVFRKIAPNYFAIRDNSFRNWNNKEMGEFGFLQEIQFKLEKTTLKLYSDYFTRQTNGKGEFENHGHEMGFSIAQNISSKTWIQTKLKVQETSSESYSYDDYNYSNVPISTFKTTFKWKYNKNNSYQFQLQEKHKQNGTPSSWGIQLRSKHVLDDWSIYGYWVTAKITEDAWIYYWDVNVPGEMKSKVFTQSSHYLGTKISYTTSKRSKIHFRFSYTWKKWDFNVIPIVRSALQINFSI